MLKTRKQVASVASLFFVCYMCYANYGLGLGLATVVWCSSVAHSLDLVFTVLLQTWVLCPLVDPWLKFGDHMVSAKPRPYNAGLVAECPAGLGAGQGPRAKLQ